MKGMPQKDCNYKILQVLKSIMIITLVHKKHEKGDTLVLNLTKQSELGKKENSKINWKNSPSISWIQSDKGEKI